MQSVPAGTAVLLHTFIQALDSVQLARNFAIVLWIFLAEELATRTENSGQRQIKGMR
jgi:hypothetical protein